MKIESGWACKRYDRFVDYHLVKEIKPDCHDTLKPNGYKGCAGCSQGYKRVEVDGVEL